ncbi:hypothetical protein, partial [Pseudomonas sp. DP16D-E2]|uniref:hypothetical protein n=1 Tax=Pseudomonas sp. DP16D-E2 TaxID=2070676 RepID=UPI001C43794F
SHRRTKADEMHMMKKAKELGFAVYNPVDLFSGHDIREVTLADDLPNYNHLSQAGHNILGKYFANALEDYLHRVKGKRF